MNIATAAPFIDDRLAMRNVLVLAAATAVGGAGAPIVFATSTIVGHGMLGDDKAWATLPVTAFVIGAALGTLPAALLMRRVGRRIGFIFGLLIGASGALTEALSVTIGSFSLLCLGAGAMGFANAFVQQFRFAAADTASPTFRPKAISWVMVGGVLAAVVGPQTAIHAKDLVPGVPFAGAFLAAACLAVLAALIVANIKIPRMGRSRGASGGRRLAEIASAPAFVIAVSCSIVSYALMSLVMTAAPLAMVHEVGHHQDAATLGIQWHVIAMFAPSFITGNLIVKFGAPRIVMTGLVLLVGCAGVALAGVSVGHFWLALVLLGIGWNFGFVGGTAMVTECYRPEEKERVQGFNDFLVFTSVAIASLLSGQLLAMGGWNLVTLVALFIAGACMVALWWQMGRSRSTDTPM